MKPVPNIKMNVVWNCLALCCVLISDFIKLKENTYL